MVKQLVSLARQDKKKLMKKLGLKTGKQYRKWEKKERRLLKEAKN